MLAYISIGNNRISSTESERQNIWNWGTFSPICAAWCSQRVNRFLHRGIQLRFKFCKIWWPGALPFFYITTAT